MRKIGNWNIITKIANVFGIIFIIFSAFAAIINYALETTIYTSAAPALFFGMSVLTAMLPFIVSAVLSFAVANITSKIEKSVPEKQQVPQVKQDVDFEETPT